MVVFNPEEISYRDLLKLFWRSHDAFSNPGFTQYRNVVFTIGDEQAKAAAESVAEIERSTKRAVATDVEPITNFFPAEDYHQKYYLRGISFLMDDIGERYRSEADFVSSLASARLNGYLGGYGTMAKFKEELPSFGLSGETEIKLTALVGSRLKK